MDSLAAAVVAGAGRDALLAEPVPEEYVAAHVRVEDVGMFDGVADRDVRKSMRVGAVPMPELAPDEVLIAVMASALNYNQVWTATFQPLPTFEFLRRLGRHDRWGARHDQPWHAVGSDAAGVVVRVGAGVRRWQAGDHVVVSAVQVDDQEPITHHDGMLGAAQKAWGYETNFGGLAEYAVVRASQVLPKPPHLTWEEAASVTQCAGTSYRMLVGEHGARIKQGDIVLIWGATGGLGVFAVQLVKNGGGIPVGIVSSPEKAELLRRLGCDVVIDRTELGIDGLDGADHGAAIEAGRRLGRAIRSRLGEDPHVTVDYTGKDTFGISVFVTRRGGTVVTCGSSTGYRHRYDNRYLWMNLKRIIGSHAANLAEQLECNRLFGLGQLVPVLSEVYPLAETGEATRQLQTNQHLGKIGIRCLAPTTGLGVTDPDLRARIGEDRLNPLAGLADGARVPASAG